MEFMGLILVFFAALHLLKRWSVHDRASVAIGLAFAITGSLHFVSPERLMVMMPPWLPFHLALVQVSGAVEMALGVALFSRRARPWAGLGLVLLLIAVFPANVHVAVSGIEVPGLPSARWYYWVRLPFQALYIAWVFWASRPATYHRIVGQKVKNAFVRVTSGDTTAFFSGIAPEFVYRFAGQSALGGERRSPEAMRRWFTRLSHLFPRIEMQVQDVLVSGWPWDTRVVLRWKDRVTPRSGSPVENAGIHLFRLRWGRVTSVDAYLDTEKIAAACRTMTDGGDPEASAAPIIG